jgi:hypothetical protein
MWLRKRESCATCQHELDCDSIKTEVFVKKLPPIDKFQPLLDSKDNQFAEERSSEIESQPNTGRRG